MKIYKIVEWDMGHRIPNHKSQCKNLHGHRYKAEICLEGSLINKSNESSEDMVMDFGEIKTILQEEIIGTCDHSFMFWEKDEVMAQFFKNNPVMKNLPVPFIPTAERIAYWVFKKLNSKFKDNFGTGLKLVEVTIWETPTSKVCYAK